MLKLVCSDQVDDMFSLGEWVLTSHAMQNIRVNMPRPVNLVDKGLALTKIELPQGG